MESFVLRPGCKAKLKSLTKTFFCINCFNSQSPYLSELSDCSWSINDVSSSISVSEISESDTDPWPCIAYSLSYICPRFEEPWFRCTCIIEVEISSSELVEPQFRREPVGETQDFGRCLCCGAVDITRDRPAAALLLLLLPVDTIRALGDARLRILDGSGPHSDPST